MTTTNFNPADYWVDGEDIVDTKAPAVEIDKVWQTRQFQARLVNPANRRKLSVIIVGTGLAGGAAAATATTAQGRRGAHEAFLMMRGRDSILSRS